MCVHAHTHTHTILSLGIHQSALTYALHVCYFNFLCSGPKKFFCISLPISPHSKTISECHEGLQMVSLLKINITLHCREALGDGSA